MDLIEQAFYDPYVSDLGPVIKSLANYDERRRTLLDERRLLEARDDDAAKLALKKLENLETMDRFVFLLIDFIYKKIEKTSLLVLLWKEQKN